MRTGHGVRVVFRDRDVVQDPNLRVYVVLGHIQPPDRVLCFLKYVPDSGGRWVSSGVRYRRVFWGGVESVVSSLDEVPRDYLVWDPHFNTRLTEIPSDCVLNHFLPEERLRQILHEGPADHLEQRAVSLAEALHDTLGISFDSVGVGGSIAWGAHNPNYSDVNMNIYGFENAWCLEHGYDALVSENSHLLLRSGDDWHNAKQRLLSRVTGVTMTDLQRLFQRRRALYCSDMCIGITPVLNPHESPIPYGSESYETVLSRPLCTRFRVDDARYGLFLPSIIYGESDWIPEINGRASRLMIYEGAFRGLVRDGDRLEVCGALQRIIRPSSHGSEDDHPQFQLMIGTQSGAGREYMRLL